MKINVGDVLKGFIAVIYFAEVRACNIFFHEVVPYSPSRSH